MIFFLCCNVSFTSFVQLYSLFGNFFLFFPFTPSKGQIHEKNLVAAALRQAQN